MKTFTLRPDGSMESMTLPDGRTETVNTQDPNTQLPTNITRLDNQTQSQAISPTGQTTSQSGAGVTPASYGYDPVTGELSSLTLFPSGSTSNTTGEETTGWKYGLSTGLLSTKTYANGSTDTFLYNNKLQLSAESLRGNTASFNYNSAGMQTGATYIGGETGTTIYDSLGTLDDLGRSHVMTEVVTPPGGATTSTSDILNYNAQGQVASETQASGATVHYDYNADSSIQDMKLYQNGQVISETDYAYDPISRRLQTITINGVTYTYTYKTNTNLIESVGTGPNTVSYGYESNTGRLQSISAGTDYSASYTYTANDQRLTENVLQENPDTQAIDQRNWTFGYDAQDQLTSVSQDGTTLYSYNYDGVGNRTDAGAVNAMNQYGGLHYNGQGDVTDDGQFSYTWDAKDRLTSATPDSLNAQSQKDVFTYDPENRRTQEDIYSWDNNNQTWVYASSLKFVYDGSQMVAELDGQNRLLQTYTWGPTGTLLSITDYSGGTPKNYQVVTDGSGNVIELLDSSIGLVAASYQYDPWGNPLSATGPAAGVSPFRWQGEFYDASFGGYYMGAREGSARLHIFLSPDPSGEASDPNLYRMVGNDPVNNTDPTGLMWSQFLQYINDEGAKHFDPWLVRTVGNVFGPNAAQATAEAAAWSRGFADDFVERTDLVRQLGNIVDHPVASFQAGGNAIDTRIAEVKQAYNETGSVRIAAGELVGTNQIAAGIENAYVIGPARPVGNGWARFNAIGNGTASTLNSIAIAGGATTGTVTFGRNVALGMQEAQLTVNLSTSARVVGSEAAAALSAQQTAVESQGFMGPTIGRSGYRTAAEFDAAVGAKYQQLVDEGYADTMKLISQGLVKNDQMVIGSRVDAYARGGMRRWLVNAEDIQEGQRRIIQVNRRLYDPSGSGAFRIPDIYISATQTTYDATIAEKTNMMAQTKDFYTFSGGGNVTIVRPSALVTPGAQGSYGLIFP